MCHLAYSAVAQPGVEAKSRYPNRFELANRFQSICKPHSPCQKPSRLAERSRSHCEPGSFWDCLHGSPKVGKEFTFGRNIAKYGARKRVAHSLPHRVRIIFCPLHLIVYSSQTSKTKYETHTSSYGSKILTGRLSLAHMSYRCDKILGIIEDRQQPAVNTIRRTHPVTGLTDITPGNAGNSQSHPKGKSPLSL
ncbi:hypothetical protein H4Q26_014706 [Puccinia striiformis f. sp. tritici PST-130]|nr:hypothetical protein H4Q26_014706 [Puccinia striiformis f. sp. tritici PST-130]